MEHFSFKSGRAMQVRSYKRTLANSVTVRILKTFITKVLESKAEQLNLCAFQ